MQSLFHFPHGLLVMLLGVPAIANALSSNTAATANRTSPVDPFREIRLLASKPSEPVCCLIPLSTEPLPTTAEFLSFEEWKSKQRELQAQASNQHPFPDAPAPDASLGLSSVTPPTVVGEPEPPLPPLAEPIPALSPHFRVPLTDRFNYASLDCSARVHTSHSSARSPAAILSSKKDRYMLSPCSADPNFVVVELCDDIRIDTVQLANFEFFSAVFRDFRVSVAQTYTSDGQEWTEAGTYRAKNIRGVQSFHPLVELRPFYRFIRIDFLSHYGSEFYCPVSLLRVYGLTQMEEWKWEVWQTGTENGARSLPDGETLAKIQENATEEASTSANGTTLAQMGTMTAATNDTIVSSGEDDRALSDTESPTPIQEIFDPPTNKTHPTSIQFTQETTTSGMSSNSHVHNSSQSITSIMILPDTSTSLMNSSDTFTDSFTSLVAATPTMNSTSVTSSNTTFSTPVSHVTSSMQILVPLPSLSPIPSGESIYRTIMNRLAMLETNTTLYQKYVEEQTLQVREALRRLEEDVGRLEGISKAQQHVFAKTMHDLEVRRRQMEEERWELLSKVNHLAGEVTLEKRLGIAQLCLLLTVLVFMALTRGSRADAVSLLDDATHRLNSFSRRPPWPSAEWARKNWASRSPTPTPTGFSTVPREYKQEARPVHISSSSWPRDTPSSAAPPKTPPARSQTPRTHSRRPSTPRRHDVTRLANIDRPSGRLRRSNSHTTPANVVLSAKRFARTAHLHEVQLSARGHQKAGGTGANAPNGYQDGPVGDDGDGSPKSRRNGKEAVRMLQDPITLPAPVRGPGVLDDETESSWVDTEPGSDPEASSDSSEYEEGAGQEIPVRAEFDYQSVSLMSAPPSTRKLESHTPPSPASVVA